MRYDVFLSYRRDPDRPLAIVLERALARLACPFYKPCALRVYRDESKQAIAADGLRPALERSLTSSRNFVLLASTESAGSRHVQWEVSRWIELHGTERLWIVLAGGDLRWDPSINDFIRDDRCPLPAVLAGRFANEPIWVDMRSFRGATRRTTHEPAFLDGAAALAAAIHGLPDKASIHSAERRQQSIFRRVVAGVVAALLALSIGLGLLYRVVLQRAVEITASKAETDSVNDGLLVRNLQTQMQRSSAELESLWQRAMRLDGADEPAELARSAHEIGSRASVQPGATNIPLTAAAGSPRRSMLEDSLRRASLDATRIRGSAAALERRIERSAPSERGRGLRLADSRVVDGFHCVAFSPDGQLLLAGGEGLALWDASTGAAIRAIDIGDAVVGACDISPDGRIGVVGTVDGRVLALGLGSGEAPREVAGRGAMVASCAFDATGGAIVVIREFGSIDVVEMPGGHIVRSAALGGSVVGVARAPDRKSVLVLTRTAESGTSARIIAVDTLAELRSASAPTLAQAAAMNSDGDVMIVGLGGAALRWRTATDTIEPVADVPASFGGVACGAGPERSFLVADAAGDLIIVEQTGKVRGPFCALGGSPSASCAVDWKRFGGLASSSDGRRVAVAGLGLGLWTLPAETTEGVVAIRMDVVEPKLLGMVAGVAARTSGLELSDDGRRFATIAGEPIVHVWDVERGDLVRTLPGLGGVASAVAFSADGEEIAAGDVDGMVCVWDLPSGALLHRIACAATPVTDIAFSQLGNELAVAHASALVERVGRANGAIHDRLSGFGTLVAFGNASDASTLYGIDARPGGPCQASVVLANQRVARNIGSIAALSMTDPRPALGTGGRCVFQSGDRLVRQFFTVDLAEGLESRRELLTPTIVTKFDASLLAVGPNGAACVVLPRSRRMIVWNAGGGVALRQLSLPFEPTTLAFGATVLLAGRSWPTIHRVDLPVETTLGLWGTTADQRQFLVGDVDGIVVQPAFSEDAIGIWSTASGFARRVVHGLRGRLVDAARSPCGLHGAATSDSGRTLVWRTSDGATVAFDVPGGSTIPTPLFVAEDLLFVADTTGRMRLLDVVEGRELRSASLEGTPPFTISTTPSGGSERHRSQVVVKALDGAISLVDPWTLEQRSTLAKTPGAVLTMGLLNESSCVCVVQPIGGVDSGLGLVIRTIDVASGEVVSESTTGPRVLSSVSFAPDGLELAAIRAAEGDPNVHDAIAIDVWTGRVTTTVHAASPLRLVRFLDDGSALVGLGARSMSTWSLGGEVLDRSRQGSHPEQPAVDLAWSAAQTIPPRTTGDAPAIIASRASPAEEPMSARDMEQRGLEYLFGINRPMAPGGAQAWLEAAALAGRDSAARRLEWGRARGIFDNRFVQAVVAPASATTHRRPAVDGMLVEEADDWIVRPDASDRPRLAMAADRGEPDALIVGVANGTARAPLDDDGAIDPELFAALAAQREREGNDDAVLMHIAVAATGNAASCRRLAELFSDGRLVAPNKVMAAVWTRRAEADQATSSIATLDPRAALIPPDELRASDEIDFNLFTSDARRQADLLRTGAAEAERRGDAPKAAELWTKAGDLLDGLSRNQPRSGLTEESGERVIAHMRAAGALASLGRMADMDDALQKARAALGDSTPIQLRSQLHILDAGRHAGAGRLVDAWNEVCAAMRLVPGDPNAIMVATDLSSRWGDYGTALELVERLPQDPQRAMFSKMLRAAKDAQPRCKEFPAVVVFDVQPGSPAARAGVAAGDILEAIDGVRPIAFQRVLDTLADGKQHEVRFASGGGSIVLAVQERLDVLLANITANTRPEGLMPLP